MLLSAECVWRITQLTITRGLDCPTAACALRSGVRASPHDAPREPRRRPVTVRLRPRARLGALAASRAERHRGRELGRHLDRGAGGQQQQLRGSCGVGQQRGGRLGERRRQRHDPRRREHEHRRDVDRDRDDLRRAAVLRRRPRRPGPARGVRRRRGRLRRLRVVSAAAPHLFDQHPAQGRQDRRAHERRRVLSVARAQGPTRSPRLADRRPDQLQGAAVIVDRVDLRPPLHRQGPVPPGQRPDRRRKFRRLVQRHTARKSDQRQRTQRNHAHLRVDRDCRRRRAVPGHHLLRRLERGHRHRQLRRQRLGRRGLDPLRHRPQPGQRLLRQPLRFTVQNRSNDP
jgi:hypothetical protein